MNKGNDPTTLTFDTSVDLTISDDDNDFSDEQDEVLDIESFWEKPMF